MVVILHSTALLTAETIPQHVFLWVASLGRCGVDLFFALSGFLITRILLETEGRGDYYKRFYLRRTLRILPLYLVVVVLVMAVSGDSRAVWYLVYFNNIVAVPTYFAGFTLSHFWSLAVEEHFYAVWPVIIRSVKRSQIAGGFVTVWLACLLLRMGLTEFAFDSDYVWKLTFCRIDALVAGASVAIAGPIRLSIPVTATAALLQAAALLESVAVENGIYIRWALASVSPLWCAWIVGLVSVSKSCWLLNIGWLRSLGGISYGVYVWHHLFANQLASVSGTFVRDFGFWGGALMSFAAMLGLAVLLARISWVLIEEPFLRLKECV